MLGIIAIAGCSLGVAPPEPAAVVIDGIGIAEEALLELAAVVIDGAKLRRPVVQEVVALAVIAILLAISAVAAVFTVMILAFRSSRGKCRRACGIHAGRRRGSSTGRMGRVSSGGQRGRSTW